jgi:hypothetical protein
MADDFTKTTLNYPATAPSAIKRVQTNRAPTTTDYKNFVQGDEWLDKSSDDWYKFVRKTGPSSGLWVRIGGTGGPLESFIVDAGTSPVLPDAANQITMSGAQVASGVVGANVLQSNGTAVNTCTYQIQQSGSAAAQDTTLNGVAHFDNAQFSVTNGFVTAGGEIAIQFDTDSGSAVPALGVLNVLGGNGCNTSASGSTITVTVNDEGINWTEVTVAGPTSMVSDRGYVANTTSPTQVALTLPSSSVLGDVIRINGKGTGTFQIQQNAGQTIHFGSTDSTPGVGGSVTADDQYGCISLRCITATTDWVVESSVGNFTIV